MREKNTQIVKDLPRIDRDKNKSTASSSSSFSSSQALKPAFALSVVGERLGATLEGGHLAVGALEGASLVNPAEVHHQLHVAGKELRTLPTLKSLSLSLSLALTGVLLMSPFYMAV